MASCLSSETSPLRISEINEIASGFSILCFDTLFFPGRWFFFLEAR